MKLFLLTYYVVNLHKYPAQLYTFDEERYRELSAKGFNFEI